MQHAETFARPPRGTGSGTSKSVEVRHRSERTLELIERFPATGARIPLVAGAVRRLPVIDFPYHVVFEEFPDRVEVLAVAHDRRRPGYWST